jgi:RND family efflux transporter MFP subunit
LILEDTKIHAPIDGVLGRFAATTGNLLVQDQTPLVTVTGIDLMCVYFELDEATVLKLRRAGALGGKKELPAEVGLRDEKEYPRKGAVDFANTRLDPRTGTLAVRALLPNPDGLLLPGMSARVRIPLPETK